MRKLSIKREKSFVGCLGTMQIFIADAEGGDLIISGVNCRKLGILKNGEEATFEIPEDKTTIYVIADKLSKEYCNEHYEIPEGTEDIALSGRNRFNPALGNAFRFNGNDQPAAIASRKKAVARGAWVLIAAVLIGFVVGYLGVAAFLEIRNSKEKEFQVGEMSITLTEGFEQSSSPAFQGVFGSKNMAVFVSKDDLDYSPAFISSFSTKEYAEYIILNSDIDSKTVEKDGLTYFVFNAEGSDGKMYKYYAYTFKTEEAHWLVQFSVEERKSERYEAKIESYAKSIKFN